MPHSNPGTWVDVVRCHPKNPWIHNGRWASALIFLTRHRIPGVSRLFARFLGCDIAVALPETVFLPHPQGIVIHDQTRLGRDVGIGHQVTLGGRDVTTAAPNIGGGDFLLARPARTAGRFFIAPAPHFGSWQPT